MAKFGLDRLSHSIRRLRPVEDRERIALITPAPGALAYLAARYVERHRLEIPVEPASPPAPSPPVLRPGLY